MTNIITRPEHIFTADFLEKIRNKAEEFEKFKFPDGHIHEGIVGHIAIITCLDDEYGYAGLVSYTYLLNRQGNKLDLDFGDFFFTAQHKIKFKDVAVKPLGKECFNGPYYKRLFLNGEPTDTVLYYGYWADCYTDYIDSEISSKCHPFERVYVGGVIRNGLCFVLGAADFEGFTEKLLIDDVILTRYCDPEAEYEHEMYQDYYDEQEREYLNSFDMDPWVTRNLYGAFDIKSRKQIIANNLDRIEAKGSSLLMYGCKYSEPEVFLARHPRKKIETVELSLDKPPYILEPWRSVLIESPNYFDEEHGIINIAPYAGLDIYDLISDNRNLLLSLVRRNYFHLDSGVIECWEEEYEDIIPKSFFNKLYIANDAHHIYRDIHSDFDKLEILGSSVYVYSEFHNRRVQLNTCLKHERTFTIKELFSNDYEYISGLIKLRRVYIDIKLLESFKGIVDSNYINDFISLVEFVRSWTDKKHEWEAEYEDFIRYEYSSTREQEDYNQLYRDAFDGEPEAEWNID